MNKLATVIALSLAAGGCEKTQGSKLDSLSAPEKKQAKAKDKDDSKPTALPVGTGTVEERVARLEQYWEKYGEAIDYLGKFYAQQKAQMEAQEAAEPDPNATFAVDVSGSVKAGMVEGPADALVTVIKAFDFACPYCETVNAQMHDMVKNGGGKVRVVYKNFVIHPDTALAGHLASCAAAKQGKYLAFKDAFWSKAFNVYKTSRDKAAMGVENIMKLSGEIGLDTAKLKADMESKDCQSLIQSDMQEMQKWRVNSTPSFFINGKVLDREHQTLEQAVDAALKVAQASGVSGGEYYEKEVIGKGLKQFRSRKEAEGGGKAEGGGGHEGHGH